MSDYKYEMQMIAEDLASENGCEYFNLDSVSQCEYFEKAISVWNDKRGAQIDALMAKQGR